ncbi:MAG TPA: dihydroneopterin aldolase [Acidimicrobiales bacterium]|nr:dihydroneopterin aldolase [Acidimicrobiales bacterium]
MSDQIELRGLVALGYCGVLREEQSRAQPLEVDLDVGLDLRKAGESDALEETIDYGVLCAMVERIITTERFTLLERLAERITEVSLADERVDEVTVSVRKLRPPVPQQLATSGVRITRRRS